MKIIHVVNSLDCGGLEIFVIDLCLSQISAGHQCYLFCLQEGGELAERAKKSNLVVFNGQKKQGVNVKLLWLMYRLFKRLSFDVVHTHNLSPMIYGNIAAKLAGTRRIVHTRHGRGLDITYRFIWNMCDSIICISEDAKQSLLICNRLEEKKVKVIHNGIDVDRFLATRSGKSINEIKLEIGIPLHKIIIGTVGRLAMEKDHASLIFAAKNLIDSGVDVLVLIIGEGPERNTLRNLISSLGLDDSVSLLGYRGDVCDLYSVFDIFALPSTSEGLSIALLEAMASGLPIVATDVGGNPEILINGSTGLMVPPSNPAKFAEALLTLIADKGLRTALGKASKAKIIQDFDAASMVEHYSEEYA